MHFSARDLGLAEAVRCPFCDGLQTELHTAFGGQLSTATYWCRRCRTAFDSFRSSPPDGAGAGSEAPSRKKVPEPEI